MPAESANALALQGLRITAKVKTKFTSGALDAVESLLNQAFEVAANRILVPALQREIATQGPPPSEPFTPPHREDLTAKEGSSAASRMGYPPLYDSIRVTPGPDGGVALTSLAPYAMYLEIGTMEMAPRPWFLSTLSRTDVVQAFNAAVVEEFQKLLGLSDGSPPTVANPARI